MAQIMVMDDDVDLAFDLNSLLMDHGHDVVWVRRGEEARDLLEQQRFDLLIIDLFIREGGQYVADGGIGLIGWVRRTGKLLENTWLAHLPIIAISGAPKITGDRYALQIARDMGADMTLEKPLVEDELLAEVALLISDNDPELVKARPRAGKGTPSQANRPGTTDDTDPSRS